MSYLPLLTQIADEADQIAVHYFRNDELASNMKADFSPVSEADIAIEKMARDLIKKEDEQFDVLGEEFEPENQNADLKLIIDPIDGTRNFVEGIPFFACLLAIEKDSEIISALISAPAFKDRWSAEAGKGAHINGKQIRVSEVSDLSQSQIYYGSLYGSEASNHQEHVVELLSKSRRQRGYGDFYAPMGVATGVADISFDFNLKPWDMAPIKLIIEEAGGVFTDLNGKPSIYSGHFLASNKILHEEALSYVSKAI